MPAHIATCDSKTSYHQPKQYNKQQQAKASKQSKQTNLMCFMLDQQRVAQKKLCEEGEEERQNE
jgi:hypothetical protein